MKNLKYLFIMFVLSLFSCLKLGDDKILNYTIQPSKHRSEGPFPILPRDCYEISFLITFSNSADVFIYDNPQQINKAFGLKEDLIPNKNSAILGYSSFNNKFELWLFVNFDDSFT